MPKYLIRCGKLPYEQYEPIDYLRRNLMGTNVGNYVYLYGIIRTLMTDENVTFESTRYRYRFNDAEIARFNEECTAFLIPLADAFRASFIKEMVGLTELVQKLTIPCYVIGVGVSENFENLMRGGGKCGYEEESRAFVKAVLEKSAMLGVRGESTGEFLQKLGFQPERDYTVIGCPGFYTYGTHLKIRTPDIRPDVPVSMNLSCYAAPETLAFLLRSAQSFQDLTFLPQMVDELRLFYLGLEYLPPNGKQEGYPQTWEHPLYSENHVRFFLDFDPWKDFLSTRNFSFGTRFHGNAVATIAGTPSLLVTKDVRMRELSAYHHLNRIDASQLEQDADIWEILADMDFHSPEVGHRERFLHYLDFLHQNDLSTIYDEDENRKDAPLDAVLAALPIQEPVESALFCERGELLRRSGLWAQHLTSQRETQKKKAEKLQKESKDEKAKRKKAEEALEQQKADDESRYQQAYAALSQQMEQLSRDLSQANEKCQNYCQILQRPSVRFAIQVRNLTLSKERKMKIDKK